MQLPHSKHEYNVIQKMDSTESFRLSSGCRAGPRSKLSAVRRPPSIKQPQNKLLDRMLMMLIGPWSSMLSAALSSFCSDSLAFL